MYDYMELSKSEQIDVMKSVFPHTTEYVDKGLIKNVSDFISGNFSKIDGFDFRWTSLITSNPLLFEDIDYLRVKPFINNTITQKEIDAYKTGNLREMYATFDNMLVCNLQYYDRIMSYCTMVFLRYVRIDEDVYDKELDDITVEIEMTPTEIWCAALSGVSSTEWELNYAWSSGRSVTTKPIEGSDKTILETSWNKLYSIPLFNKFMKYCAIRCGTSGFRQTFIRDKTPNRKLSQVCSKFTRTSVAISDQQLETIHRYNRETNEINDELFLVLEKCLHDMFAGDKSQYCVYIFPNEFYINTSKFSLRVSKDDKGGITKDYLANTYECFAAEEFLVPSIRTQIKWAKYKQPVQYDFDKNILRSLLHNMLEENYRDIVCIKRMNDYGMVSKVTFKGMFANVTMVEEFMFENRVIRTNNKTLSKKNASKYLIDRGYVLFGTSNDIALFDGSINQESITKHYLNYCVPVIQHMSDVIALHEMNKNDIVDFVVSGTLNPNKIKNHKIRRANIQSRMKERDILQDLKNVNKTLQGKTSYWKAIED